METDRFFPLSLSVSSWAKCGCCLDFWACTTYLFWMIGNVSLKSCLIKAQISTQTVYWFIYSFVFLPWNLPLSPPKKIPTNQTWLLGILESSGLEETARSLGNFISALKIQQTLFFVFVAFSVLFIWSSFS